MVSAHILKSFELFVEFNEAELQKFADLGVEETYKAGVRLWKKGDEAKTLMLLVEGKAVMTLIMDAGPGMEPISITVDTAAKGESLGWSSVVEPFVYTRAVRCLDDSKVISFDAASLRGILNEDKALGFKFMNGIAKVLRNRLSHTEIILAGERGLATLTEMYEK
jgi:CRP-like cAMP-binding protein